MASRTRRNQKPARAKRRAPARRSSRKAPSTMPASLTRDQRSKEILRAAVRVFAEKGYHATRISDVAKEANVAYGLVYHYFGNKDALLRTIFETNWAVFLKAVDAIATSKVPSAEKLRQVVDFLVNAFEVTPLIVKVLILEFGRTSRFGDALETPEMDHLLDTIERIFRSAKKRGELRDGLTARAASIVFLGAIDAALVSFVLPFPEGDSRVSQRRVSRQIAEAREALLAVSVRGLLNESAHAGLQE